VLTASDATQYAWEGDKVIGDTQKSVFTHFLIEGLKGEADRDGDGRIRVDELYDYTYEQVVHLTPKQTPGKWSYKQQGNIILRENLKIHEVKPAPLPSDLLEALSQPSSFMRSSGVQELIRLLDGKNLGLARAAEEKLREIAAGDDSLRLRKTASETLVSRGFTLEPPMPPETPKSESKPDEKPEIEKLSSQAIQYELKGDFWNALQTYYKIKRIDPAFPRVDIKIAELEKELRPKPEKTVQQGEGLNVGKRSIPAQKPISWRFTTGVIAGLFLFSLVVWSSAKLFQNLPYGNPKATNTLQLNLTFTPQPEDTPFASPTTAVPTTNLGIGSTLVSEKDGITLLYVPASEFTMGSDNYGSEEKPAHKVTLDAFWIDRTEVTNAMYAKCVQDFLYACNEPSDTSYYSDPSYADHPVVYVSWNDAKVYCEWADRRLPTEAEWEKAARGTDGRIYPWGDALPIRNFGNFSNYSGETSAVGQFPDGRSLYGALDMAGNVYEWLSSLYKPYPYSATDGREDLSELGERVIRGGSWALNSVVRSSSRSRADPTTAKDTIGFRCARSE
jgi:formylglycine-generating enzyme required for sulfatase activity